MSTQDAPTTNAEVALLNSVKRMDDLVANMILSRTDLMQSLIDPRRDLDQECGYPKEPILPSYYQELYERDPIGNRVVEVIPEECWEIQPLIYEQEDPEQTPFEEDWDNLSRGLLDGGLGESWYQDDEGSPILEAMERVDKLSGIGRYAILLLGLSDGKDLREPAGPKAGQKLTFLQCYPESLATVAEVETAQDSPRLDQPTLYQVTFMDPNSFGAGEASSGSSRVRMVHHSRVVHVADNVRSNRVYGDPRMHPVLPRVLDLRKLYGSSAEMFYLGGFPGYSFETIPQLGGNVRVDEQKTRDMFEQWRHSLTRLLVLKGMSAKSLAPQVADPLNQINCHLDAICIKLGIPKRVFLGSERGELASSQDERAWDRRKKRRRNSHVTPTIVVPLVNRLIWLKVLTEPKGFSVFWPDPTVATPDEQADLGNKLVMMLSAFIKGNCRSMMTEEDFWTKIAGKTVEEAEQLVEAAAKQAEADLEKAPPPQMGLGGGFGGGNGQRGANGQPVAPGRPNGGAGRGTPLPGVTSPQQGPAGQIRR